MVIGTIFDSAYAIVFGKFRKLMSSKYLKLLNYIGGSLLTLLGFLASVKLIITNYE